MGVEIDREFFDEADFLRFERRLTPSLEALQLLLARPGFGAGAPSLGVELELDLVDAAGRPRPLNRAVLAETVDRRVTLEVNRFNLEVNSHPVLLGGRPFSALAAELTGALAEVARAAAHHDARPICIGILPTLTESALAPAALTDRPRYRALSAGLRRLRRQPFPVEIAGPVDRLTMTTDDVTFEGANTSFQVHLRVEPATFARFHAAAQIATAPVLAAAGNSPLFLGRRLWEETRVALFGQSVDDRANVQEDDWRPARVSFGHGWVREGAWELFAESVALHRPLLPVMSEEDPVPIVRAGGVPGLAELRLHHGTVWRWNRAVYDPHGGGHLRVELRALPAGPTVADMVANAAFLVGLTLALAPQVPQLLPGFPFKQALRNFCEAARHGLGASLLWPAQPGAAATPAPAGELGRRLLPLAAEALVAAGVEAEEAHGWLAIIEGRLASGQTGARWQRQAFDSALGGAASPTDQQRESAGAAVVEGYLARAASNSPVHGWDPL